MNLGLGISLGASGATNEPVAPSTLANVRALWRADQGVNPISGKASSWSPQGPNGLTALTNGTAGSRPTIVANGTPAGRPSLQFDNTDDVMTGGALSEWVTDTGGTVYTLAKQTGVDQANPQAYQDHAMWNRGAYAGVSAKVGPLVRAHLFDGAFKATAGQAIVLGVWNVLRWRLSGGSLYLRVNNNAEGVGVAAGTIGDVASAVTIGNGASASPANAEIAAIVPMRTSVTAAEDAVIMAWFNWYASLGL